MLDASSAESMACLAAEHFYSDQPELAIRYYRRLLQVCWGGESGLLPSVQGGWGCVANEAIYIMVEGLRRQSSTASNPALTG